jgi:hypothetical protein
MTAAPTAAVTALSDDPIVLKQMILELLATLQEARQEREQLQRGQSSWRCINASPSMGTWSRSTRRR